MRRFSVLSVAAFFIKPWSQNMKHNSITIKVQSLPRLLFNKPLQIIRINFRAYLIINAIVYGLVIAGMVSAMIFPNLGATQLAMLENSGTLGLVRSLLNTPWLFALTILGVNVMTSALLIVNWP